MKTSLVRPLAFLLAFVGLAGCTDVSPTAGNAVLGSNSSLSVQAPRLAPPVLERRTPEYPAIAVYIVYREFVNSHPGIRTLSPDNTEYQRYIEKRLRELYPERGYAGMMRDAVAEMKRNREAWQNYERQVRPHGRSTAVDCEVQMMSFLAECGGSGGGGATNPSFTEYPTDPSWVGNEEYIVDETLVPTLQEEVDSLQLTPTEANGLYYYETLALAEGDFRGGVQPTSANSLSRDELIRRAAAGANPASGPSVQALPLLVAVPLGIAAFFGPRIVFSWWRAVDAAGDYYPTLDEADTKRDAFRHTYVNVMLRRYCSGTIAKLIMDANEARVENNPWGSRMMDYHNNDLGRSVRYEHFRGHWLWDRWSWGVWGHRVRRYIDDTRNGVLTESFLNTSISESSARSIEAGIADYKYIYLR